jgi:hypothetical protein
VALEMSPESARALALAILHTLDTVPSGQLSERVS